MVSIFSTFSTQSGIKERFYEVIMVGTDVVNSLKEVIMVRANEVQSLMQFLWLEPMRYTC